MDDDLTYTPKCEIINPLLYLVTKIYDKGLEKEFLPMGMFIRDRSVGCHVERAFIGHCICGEVVIGAENWHEESDHCVACELEKNSNTVDV